MVAIVAEVDVTLDVPIGLLQLSHSSAGLLTVSYNQLFSVYKWNCIPGIVRIVRYLMKFLFVGTTNQPSQVYIEIDQTNCKYSSDCHLLLMIVQLLVLKHVLVSLWINQCLLLRHVSQPHLLLIIF